ncbi:MAG: glycosyltransferase family 4 protein [Microcoleaceae cyanobacterium]
MTQINTLLLATADGGNGADRAAYRLHQGLQQMGTPSQMLVHASATRDPTVHTLQSSTEKALARLNLAERFDGLPLQAYRQRDRNIFSAQWLPNSLPAKVKQLQPDIINLHWVCKGYLKIEHFRQFSQPLVWTAHDMWPFTGGCHYTQECDRYMKSCGACPQLKSDKESDLSRWVWQRKAKAWQDLNLTLVTPSQWLADCANSSPLFQDKRIEVIPNGIDLSVYKPMTRALARDRLNLPQNKHLILFGARAADEKRKGFDLLQAALQRLSREKWQDEIELVVFGSLDSQTSLELGFPVHSLGRLGDDLSLALIYAAADVFVASSLQDNLPNTVVESIAAGTPCVAFKIGGMPDMIEHQLNGYLAQPFEVEDLATGIDWVLSDKTRYPQLCDRARQKAEAEFSSLLQARRYLALYTELLQDSPLSQHRI